MISDEDREAANTLWLQVVKSLSPYLLTVGVGLDNDEVCIFLYLHNSVNINSLNDIPEQVDGRPVIVKRTSSLVPLSTNIKGGSVICSLQEEA